VKDKDQGIEKCHIADEARHGAPPGELTDAILKRQRHRKIVADDRHAGNFKEETGSARG
jgi:hypothetical protein